MHHDLESYAYTNRLRFLPPSQKSIFVLSLLVITSTTHWPTQLAIAVWLAWSLIVYAKIPSRIYGQVLGLAIAFLLASLPALVLDIWPNSGLVDRPVLALAGVAIGPWYVGLSSVGLQQALTISSRSIASVSCLLFLIFTTPIAELFSLLRRCHVPRVLIDLVLLMYRFIFLFLDVVHQLQLAQKARGGYRNKTAWQRSIALLIRQLFVRSLQRYKDFSLGLAARGFNGNLDTYSPLIYQSSRRYTWEAILGCLGLISFDQILRVMIL